jgi:hypothetical protein
MVSTQKLGVKTWCQHGVNSVSCQSPDATFAETSGEGFQKTSGRLWETSFASLLARGFQKPSRRSLGVDPDQLLEKASRMLLGDFWRALLEDSGRPLPETSKRPPSEESQENLPKSFFFKKNWPPGFPRIRNSRSVIWAILRIRLYIGQ